MQVIAERKEIGEGGFCEQLIVAASLVLGVFVYLRTKTTTLISPYAFVENVVTHSDYRGKGYATQCLNFAKDIAQKMNCYKMMLLTGSKEDKTLGFYQNTGYNSSDKTAFIQWI